MVDYTTGAWTSGAWVPSAWGISPAGGDDGGEPPPDESISFTLPGSEIFPSTGDDALFYARRGLVGGRLARCWVAFDQGETTYVAAFRHNGSYADPSIFVPALAAATVVEVDLGSAAMTASEVATATVDALTLAGVTGATALDGQVTVEAATNLVVPPSVDLTDTSLRGMWGNQRANWGTGGEGQDVNQNGGTGGTGSVHLGQLGTAGRAIGMYVWTRTDGVATVIRLAASTGPTYSTTPGMMTILAQGSETVQGFGTVLADAAAFGASANVWAQYRSNTAGTAGIVYRAHGASPEGSGNLGVGQSLVWDTTASQSAATAFLATYNPTSNADFPIYVCIGIIFEFPDADGNYHADGSLTFRIGDQNNDPEHGVQFAADSSFLLGETTHHRFRWLNLDGLALTEVWRTVAAIGGDEDSAVAIYSWNDLDFPSTVPADLVADLGQMGLALVGANQYVLEDPIDVSETAVGTDAILSLGFNYLRNGGELAAYTLPVYLSTSGDEYWGDCWEDDRETWHDDIPGASGRGYAAGISEYRTRVSQGNNGMPTDWGVPWPDPFATDETDDSPAAIAPDWIICTSAGIAEAA
jgi:hypothetical protein